MKIIWFNYATNDFLMLKTLIPPFWITCSWLRREFFSFIGQKLIGFCFAYHLQLMLITCFDKTTNTCMRRKSTKTLCVKNFFSPSSIHFVGIMGFFTRPSRANHNAAACFFYHSINFTYFQSAKMKVDTLWMKKINILLSLLLSLCSFVMNNLYLKKKKWSLEWH